MHRMEGPFEPSFQFEKIEYKMVWVISAAFSISLIFFKMKFAALQSLTWVLPTFWMVAWTFAGFSTTRVYDQNRRFHQDQWAMDLIWNGGGVFVIFRYGLIFCVSSAASVFTAEHIYRSFKSYLPLRGIEALKNKDVSLEAILAMAGAFVVTMLLLLTLDAFLGNRARFRRERHCREEGEARQAWLSAALLDVDGERSARLAKLRQGPEAIGENIGYDGISDVPFMIASGAIDPLVAYWKALVEEDEEGGVVEENLREAVKTLNAAGQSEDFFRSRYPGNAFLGMLCNTPLGPDRPPPRLDALIYLEWGAFDRGSKLARKALIHFGEHAPGALVRGIGHSTPKNVRWLKRDDAAWGVVKKLHQNSPNPATREAAKFLLRRAGWMGWISDLVRADDS